MCAERETGEIDQKSQPLPASSEEGAPTSEPEISAPEDNCDADATPIEAEPEVTRSPDTTTDSPLPTPEAPGTDAEDIPMPEELAGTVAELQGLMVGFGERLERHLSETAEFSRSAFDRLYEEMRQYKDNFVFEVRRGLLQDVLLLYDGIEQLKHHYADAGTVDLEALIGNLDGLAVEAEEILLRRGLERLTDSPEKLDAHLQKTFRVLHTDNPDEDLTIAERLKTGFKLGERMFRKEEVVIKKYTPDASETETSDAATSVPDR